MVFPVFLNIYLLIPEDLVIFRDKYTVYGRSIVRSDEQGWILG